MSCCGLFPALRQKFRSRRNPKQSDITESMEEEAAREPTEATIDESTTTEDVVVEEVGGPSLRVSEVEYVATGYCGLCRTQLPHNPLPVLEKRTEPWEQWERDCRAVLCVDVDNESDHLITPPFLLHDQDFDVAVGTPVTHSKIDGVVIQLKVPLLDNHLAYVFHSWCYDVLRSKTERSDPGTIYRLAKSLSHEASPWETIGTDGDGWLDPPSRIGTLIGDLNDEEAAKLQPGFLSRLPAELRAPIWRAVGMRSAYSSFLLVSEETARLLPKLTQAGESSLSIEKGSFLSWEAINLFGTKYLRTLSNEKTKDAVEIKEQLSAIRIIASLPGVCAMKLIGTEAWESEWIGHVPLAGQVWYGTLETLGPTVNVKFTGLTLLDIKHKAPPQLMWDRPDFPPYLIERDQLKDEAVWLRWQSASRFEFIRHLPLFCGKEAARGLTLYCNELGIIGIAAHFSNTTYFSGYRDGMPTYIAFESGEGIRNMWYRLGINQMDAPGFVIQTTKNRAYHVGPYMLPTIQSPLCRWASLNNYAYTSITSIFYQNPRREIFCCAVHGPTNNRVLLSRTTYAPPCPIAVCPTLDSLTEEQPTPSKGVFFSMAKLDGVRKVQACKVGSRIVGLLLSYQDGTETVLGQWYVEGTYSKARNEVLFNKGISGDGTASTMSFWLEGPQNKRIVVGVGVIAEGGQGRILEGADIKVDFWQGQTIVWWYSQDYDHLALWQSEWYEIPPEHHLALDPGN